MLINLKNYLESSTCICVNSGTAALHLALSMFDIKNKEVILPSLSFVSTAHAVLYNGGIPKFVDIDPKTLCIDPEKIKDSISGKTSLILPVHFAGMSCDLESLSKICKYNSLFLVEDAAHAIGSTYKNKKIGSHGDAVCFSFHPSKNLPTPTGGAITINNPKKIQNNLKSLRWCGISNRIATDYSVNEIGWNYYMNEFSASIGISQLKKLNKNIPIRKKIAKQFFNELNVDRKMPFDQNCSYHFYWILVKNRKNFIKNMSDSGVEVGVHYKPIHKFNLYKSKNILSETELIQNKIVSIPCHQSLNQNDVNKIIKLVNKFSSY